MTDHVPCGNLSEDINEIKEKIVYRENSWRIPDRYYLELDLNPSQALLLTIIRQTGKKKGYSEISYSYISKYTKQKDKKTIAKDLEELESKNLVYIHRYVSRRGSRRKYVHQDNAARYWSYLGNIKQYKERKKFEEEFMSKIPVEIDPDDEPGGNNPQSKLGGGKNPPAAGGNNPPAINTTYLSNKRNDVTCKSPSGPAASDEASSAASSSDLKKELEQTFSAQEVSIGMKWYELQTDHKRSSMKKPIACIVKALKEGYAHREVASKNAEMAAELSQQRETTLKKLEAKKETAANERLANQLSVKFSHCPGWRHKLDSKCFVVYYDGAEKVQDEDAGCFVWHMPDGTKRFLIPAVRVNFDLPHSTFKSRLKSFFKECQWEEDTPKKEASA